MSYSRHRKLRLLQSTRLNPLVKVNSTPKSLRLATPTPTRILSVRSPKTGLLETTLPQIVIDQLLGRTLVQEQEARVARHTLSTMGPVAIEAIEEVGTTTGVEA